jgi:peptidoglycan/LPS O-acetylase OafA/YrhL
MVKSIKCFVRESKNNFSSCMAFATGIPRGILTIFTIIFPVAVFCVWLVIAKPSQEFITNSLYPVGMVVVTIIWMAFLGFPLDSCYINPDGTNRTLATRIKENLIGSVYICKRLPRLALAGLVVFLPLVTLVPYSLSQTNADGSTSYVVLVMILGSILGSFLYIFLIGVPIVDCYIYPSERKLSEQPSEEPATI